MGDHILRIQLAELLLVRVYCKGCGATIEVLLRDLANTFVEPQCPCCRKRWSKPQKQVDLFAALQRAVEDMLELQDKFQIEFPLRLEDK